MSNAKMYSFRIEQDLLEAYQAAVKSIDSDQSKEFRRFMREFVKLHGTNCKEKTK